MKSAAVRGARPRQTQNAPRAAPSVPVTGYALPNALARFRRAPLGLTAAATAVGLLAVMPLIYIVWRAAQASPETWGRLWSGQIPGLLANTLALLVTTAAFTAGLGLALAWLVERTDLPGRSLWRWLLALPIAVPAYVGALCYLIVFRRGGLLEQAAMQWGGLAFGALPLPNLYSLWGATFIIGLFTFPYVYLPTAAALRATNWSMEEAARVAGRDAWGAFRDVVLPLIAPALLAGVLLVGLYVLGDFGTVKLIHFRTFTAAIFNQFTGQVNREGAAILSFVLIALTAPLLAAEARLNRHRPVAPPNWRPRRLAPLGRWRWLALAFCGAAAFFALGLPFAVLGGLTLQGWLMPTEVDRLWSVGGENIWRYGLNSLLLSGLAATLAVILAFAPAYLAARQAHPLARALLTLSKAGYALPGVIAGLSLILLFNQFVPALYGTLAVLVIGFAARFLPQAAAVNEAAVKAVPPTLEQAARLMGRTPWQTFREVTLPLAAPGLKASWVLVFLTAMKELPTAVLLRPPGFDTLPVRVWAAASESVYTQAAPPAFLLITLTLLVLGLLFARGRFGLDEVVY
jgi:iron(III) transport system permease protein